MRCLLTIVIHVIVFVALRYINIIMIFLNGIGPYYKYSFYDYLPSLLIQIGYIIFVIIRNKSSKKEILIYGFITFLLILLYVGSHFGIIPHEFVPK